jgi:hypothetical protein
VKVEEVQAIRKRLPRSVVQVALWKINQTKLSGRALMERHNWLIAAAMVKYADGDAALWLGEKRRNIQQSDYTSVTSQSRYFAILSAEFIASVNTGALAKRFSLTQIACVNGT